MRRHCRRKAAVAGGLPPEQDGMLDVLANLVGVLTLVGALSATVAVNTSIRIRTPLAQETNKEFLMLQAGEDGIWDLQPARDRMWQLRSQQAAGYTACWNYYYSTLTYRGALRFLLDCVERMDRWSASEKVGSAFVSVNPHGSYIERLEEPTINMKDLEEDNILLRSHLSQASKENKAIFVILEKEGFETYRKIRSVAAENNLQIGWEPWGTGEPISFGSGGRSMRVQ